MASTVSCMRRFCSRSSARRARSASVVRCASRLRARLASASCAARRSTLISVPVAMTCTTWIPAET
ncbi:hypothetical protein [Dactylosporangium sp. NPDC050588]|uniref:hypothetical protein n=1 Tax=Dactylosporangium sp. NPDC050588 TaxID=3157211 RepID=UPI0033DFBABD